MKVRIFVGQAFTLDLGPNHEGVHRPPDALLLLALGLRGRPRAGVVGVAVVATVVVGGGLAPKEGGVVVAGGRSVGPP